MNEETALPQQDKIRQLIDLAVESGRSRQSEQTGYLHYYYHQEDGIHLSIPTYENMLFALALLRTKTAENILEAKSLIEKLLYFQNGESGNFPIYLHEYPQCKDRSTGVRLLLPMYWICRLFSHILPSELRSRLEESLKSLIEYCITAHKEKPFAYPLAVKTAASCKALGGLWLLKDIENAGELLLEQLKEDSTQWSVSSNIAEILASLQMLNPNISQSPWKAFWDFVDGSWHADSYCYAGPAVKESQREFEPKAALYDLFLGYYSGAFSKRAEQKFTHHLQGALIQPSTDHLSLKNYPVKLQGKHLESSWTMIQEKEYALSTVEALSNDKNFHCFRLLWGNQSRTHSLVCQGGNYNVISSEVLPDICEFIFSLSDVVQCDDREKSREIAFFFDLQDGAAITVEGHPSTTFQLNERLLICTDLLSFELTFSLMEGDGQFLGHIMMGNRPSQMANSGENRFKAYDWQIFLRTIKRSSACRIKAFLKVIGNTL